MKVLLFAAILGVALAAPNTQQIKFRNLYKEPFAPIKSTHTGRIIGGQVAEPNSIPYQAFMTVYGQFGAWYCSGTLINESVLLTAGHCSYEANSAVVVLGAQTPLTPEDSQIIVETSNFVIHPDFDMHYILNDISLIRFNEPVELTNAIQLATLPKDGSDNYVGKTGRVSGWGLADADANDISDVLRYVENPILPNEECGESFGPIPDYQMCMSGAYNRGFCGGDSGGPLTVDGVQVGIVSYGMTLCAEDYPSYFTRVSSFLNWIAEN